MSKFKNTTGLNQVVVIEGKKKLVRKDGVLELRDDFIQVGFEKVPDNTPLTVRTTTSKVASNDEIQELKNKISELEERFNSNETISQIETKIQEISEQALELGGDTVKDVKELRDLVDALSKAVSNQAQVMQHFKDNDAMYVRRLDILKTAMQAMEMQVDEITGMSDEMGNE